MDSVTVVYTTQSGATIVRSNIEYFSFNDAILSYKLVGTDGSFKVAGVMKLSAFSYGELIFISN